ncbi:oxygen-insensitive NAD(P)H nitroreductase [Shewanella sp. 202IG2-18]|uniref:oxygen-insensitive NAD(P)H nitroreductase n=1 Tax=Parashewanella hymeniacidonis TaxID=2807618 RepID=UPI00196027C5|nr:oxygen-insensitive NAD(P)H nitroreductase [Parashewanella hymeniacidonis]MBM7074136.1 oxygen-insensitive NAD(P)H nitroreductase [Parashewanella hymeniacidonis]
MNFNDIMLNRYSTKEFDSKKKISPALLEQIYALLRFSPSSVNSQPWHFLIAETAAAKQRVAKGSEKYDFNTQKILDASHVVVFCARTEMSETFLNHLTETEDKDGRYDAPEFKAMVHGVRKMFVDLHRFDFKDLQHWLEKQVYLNIGSLLTGAAVLGIDALPMEGIDMPALDSEFGLREQGFTAVGVVALGYRSETDFNAGLPKSRLPASEIISTING